MYYSRMAVIDMSFGRIGNCSCLDLSERKKEGYFMKEIQLRGISKEIKGVTVLKDIDMVLKSGTIYGLRGKNGCGKTMLMRTICGLIIPTKGEVIIEDKVLHKDIAFPHSICALIENPSFLPQYTGFKNLKMLGSIQGNISHEDIELAMERVGLDSKDTRT